MKIQNSAGLSIEFHDGGSLRHILAGSLRISLLSLSPLSPFGANLFLRKRTAGISYTPLIGPKSKSRMRIADQAMFFEGEWETIEYRGFLCCHDKALNWSWQVDLKNNGEDTMELDLVLVQDVGLKSGLATPVNEHYVSQYLERRILEDPQYGKVVCCRQNMQEEGGHPWLIMASKNGSASACTDGMQVFGASCRATGQPESLKTPFLGGEYAGESALLALQERPFALSSEKHHQSVFVMGYLPDHPEAISVHDLKNLPALFEDAYKVSLKKILPAGFLTVRSLFQTAPFFPSQDLTETDLNLFFGSARRHAEENDGHLLSFFTPEGTHVVLKSKELITNRPHAQILQAYTGFVPHEGVVSTTVFAFGVFNSHLTQGNTNFNSLLSVCTNPFNLSPETGQRIFIESEGRWFLLGVPSAFEMGLNHVRWIYKAGNLLLQIRTWTSPDAPRVFMDFRVLSGQKLNLLVTHHFDPLNGWRTVPGSRAEEILALPAPGSILDEKFPEGHFRFLINSQGADVNLFGDEILYEDRQSRSNDIFSIHVSQSQQVVISIYGEINAVTSLLPLKDPDLQWQSDVKDAGYFWETLSLGLSLEGNHPDIAAIREILPWFGMNAMVHFLTPYGLEQFGGAAWGTRDVSQGPLDLLLTMEQYRAARKVLEIIFSNQNPDGGWPQWWMFDRYASVRADGMHGDIFYWCIIGLCDYIKATGETSILNDVLPYYHPKGTPEAEFTPLSEHVERLIGMIIRSFLPGTALVPFGGGDWNDSLQPVSKELASRLVSSWTVEMNYQAFSRYCEVYRMTGNLEKADTLMEVCQRIRSDYNKHLIVDSLVAGYGLLGEDGTFSPLLHPKDDVTGIHYSLLPMNRGIISEIFTPEQARQHLSVMEEKLKGPDGARLMDRPLKYKGGIQTLFQRAESSTFFGREIGLMYIHEHLRHAEALAMMGKADDFVKALRQANPVAYREIVTCGDFRQSNCYYSSSDVCFRTRYEADELYPEIIAGKHTLCGGWRVYSSGPGIYIGLVVSRLLGIRKESKQLILDPVIPDHFDGFKASMKILGRKVQLSFHVREDNYGPKLLTINNLSVSFSREENPYRLAGALISLTDFLSLTNLRENFIEITV